MKMKKLSLICAICFMAIAGFSQSVQPSSKVAAGIEQSHIQSFTNEELNYWNYYSSHSYTIHGEAKTTEGVPMLSSVLKEGVALDVETLSNETFNPLQLRVNPLSTESQFFILDGTNKVLQLFSQEIIDRNYSMHKVNEAKKLRNQNK